MKGLDILGKRLAYGSLTIKFYIYMAFNLRRLKKYKKDSNRDKFMKLAEKADKYYADSIFNSSKTSFEVIGQEKIDIDQTYLLVSIHLGMADIASILKAFPKHVAFVSKKELSKVPILSEWMRTSGSVFIDRENTRDSIEKLNNAIENLKSGICMCVYPEGTRSKTGEMGEFKKGSFKLALKSNAKILPIALSGTRSVYEDNSNRITKGSVRVCFLDPIDINELTKEEIKNIHILVREKINDKYKTLI